MEKTIGCVATNVQISEKFSELVVACLDPLYISGYLEILKTECGLPENYFGMFNPGGIKIFLEKYADIQSSPIGQLTHHGIQKITIMAHSNCRAYSYMNFENTVSEKAFHRQVLEGARDSILITYPSLEVILHYVTRIESGNGGKTLIKVAEFR